MLELPSLSRIEESNTTLNPISSSKNDADNKSGFRYDVASAIGDIQRLSDLAENIYTVFNFQSEFKVITVFSTFFVVDLVKIITDIPDVLQVTCFKVILEVVQSIAYMHFCGFKRNSVIFYSCILFYQCYCILREYSRSPTRSTFDGFTIQVFIWRAGLGGLFFSRTHKYYFVNELNSRGYGYFNGIFTIINLNIQALIFTLAPSFQSRKFQLLLVIYMWSDIFIIEFFRELLNSFMQLGPDSPRPSVEDKEIPESRKTESREAESGQSSSILGSIYFFFIIGLYHYVFQVEAVVVANPLVRSKSFQNGLDHTACAFAILGLVSYTLLACGLCCTFFFLFSSGLLSDDSRDKKKDKICQNCGSLEHDENSCTENEVRSSFAKVRDTITDKFEDALRSSLSDSVKESFITNAISIKKSLKSL